MIEHIVSLNEFLLIKEVKEEKAKGGFIISGGEAHFGKAEVISVPKEILDGVRQAPNGFKQTLDGVKPGTIVIFVKSLALEAGLGLAKEYLFVEAKNVVGRIDAE